MEAVWRGLPNDFLKIEIVSHCSLTSFNAIKCTSKHYESLTYDDFILKLKKQRTTTVCGFLVQTYLDWLDTEFVHDFTPARGSPTIDLDFVPLCSQILACSEHSLMVFTTPHPRLAFLERFHVSKPATGQFTPIPNPKTRYPTVVVYVLTMNSSPLRYKILRVLKCRPIQICGIKYRPIRFEVFDSNAWAWRIYGFLRLPSFIYPKEEQPIIIRGQVYLLLNNTNIIKFDCYSDAFTIFPPPVKTPNLSNPLHKFVQLLKVDSTLGLAYKMLDDRWKVWVRAHDGLWTNIYVLSEPTCEDVSVLEFDNPFSTLKVPNKGFLLFNGNVVETAALSSWTLFVLKLDCDPVNLRGGN